MADKMVRCPEGHFYDPSKHQACPWCALPPDAGSNQQKTRPVGQVESPPPLPTVPMGAKPGATRRVGMDAATGSKLEPVVGWLVCLDGPDRGRDFRLHAEKNFIGRSQAMDVCIPSDDTISREKHGIVIFDPKKQMFWILPGDASGLVYLNGEIVHSPTQFKRDDVLEVGQTKLVLVPFCGDKYSWTSEFVETVQRPQE
jgi:hypothetical protein